MLTQAPLPNWLNLCRALFKRSPTDMELLAPWTQEGEIAGWLSRSAWSLALIALWRKKREATSGVTVWIPDFFCNASLVALRQAGVKLVFYPLTEKKVMDIAACRKLAIDTPPDLFVLVHYFGQPTHAAVARDFCAQHGAWLIEDAVHLLRPVSGVGVYGDFVLYSPHKHLPIPDGAVLVVRADGSGLLERESLEDFATPNNWSDQLHGLQKELGRSVKSGRVWAVVWLIKRVLQKLLGDLSRGASVPFAEVSDVFSVPVASSIVAPAQTTLSKRLMAVLLPDLADVARERQHRQLLWDFLLSDSEPLRSGGVSPAERPVGREWTPYLNAYLTDYETARLVYNRWQTLGLPVTTWPDLPPELTESPERHTNAQQLRFCRLYLPIHQTLSKSKMLALGRSPAKVEEEESSLILRWESATRGQWHKWMEQSGRSNLLQSWAYGEAKSNSSGWRVRRGVFYANNEPIAIVQILEKRVAGVIKIIRINRGPLYLRVLLPQELRAVWKKLTLLGNLWQGRLLSVAPELVLSGSSLALMGNMGLRHISSQAYESIWVDLQLNLETLRKQIKGKWRNMLTSSEKNSFQINLGCDANLFDWMMEQYQLQMKEKNYNGPSVSLIESLRDNLDAHEQLLILRADHEGEAVGGVCLVCHGLAATYLLGFNTSKGRKLKVNHYLLWKAIVHLKQQGIHWFDLGGISEEKTPGITAFKLGLNGERYELVGEYWKW